ncbi:MAG: DNA translocase FtsK 4TM domain-containing protein, partial [Bacteroidales bacterium]
MAKKKKANNGFLKSFIRFFRDERFRITFGTFLILFAIYMLLAFISYFFTWKADQDFRWAAVFSGPDITVENHAGKIGAWLSAQFLNRWFGLASFSAPLFLLIIGTNMIGLKIFNT